MTVPRAGVIVVAVIGLCLSQMAHAQSPRRPDGGVFAHPNIPPDRLTQADVDTLMWPIVSRLNRSGWVWTTESCQGHPGGWPLTLGIVTHDPGRFFALLARAEQAAESRGASGELTDPTGLLFEVQFWRHSAFPARGIEIRFTARVEGEWPTARRVLLAVADAS